jgi:hypothetical protein
MKTVSQLKDLSGGEGFRSAGIKSWCDALQPGGCEPIALQAYFV